MTVHTPPRTSYSQLVLDITLSPQKLVLMDTGNYPSFSNYLNETWLFSGTGTPDWTNTGATLIDANGPLPPRTDFVMSYDGIGVMLYGGRGASSMDGVLQDTWTYDGASPTVWTKQNPANVPFGRYKAQACFLLGSGVIMFGGGIANGQLLNETWLWSSGTWSQISTPNTTDGTPPARTGHVIAANDIQVIMFGGRGTNSQFNDTWSYTAAGGWSRLTPTGTPSIRSEACMAWDSVNSVFVLFGGQNEYHYLPETYTFNPSGSGTWTKVAAINSPAGKIGAQMAFDPVSGKTIMFGGIDATTNNASNQSWAFDAALGQWSLL